MTAWLVHRLAELLGLPGDALALLAAHLDSKPLMHAAIALKGPQWALHGFGCHLEGR